MDCANSLASSQVNVMGNINDPFLDGQRVEVTFSSSPAAMPPPTASLAAARLYSLQLSIAGQSTSRLHHSPCDTTRDAILTCARKLTRVSLICRTETTTKNCKTEKKLKSKNGYGRSNSKSPRNHVVSPEEEKERLQWEGFAP